MRPLLLLNLIGKAVALVLAGPAPVWALASWFLPDLLLAYQIFMPHAQLLVRGPRTFVTERNEVWLTIDDGPDASDTPRILELLAAHGARATFFVIGRNAAARPDLIRAILAGGHEVAHHTHTHPVAHFWCASPRRLARELDDALAALRALGVKPTRFRSPASHKNIWLQSALQSRGLTYVGWSARGLERWSPGPESVADRVLQDLAPGRILLLHEGPRVPAAVRVHGISRVLERLRERGYRCVLPEAGQLRN